MKCTICRVKINLRTSVPVSVRHADGKMSGPCCERCAERVASGKVKMPATNKQEAA